MPDPLAPSSALEAALSKACEDARAAHPEVRADPAAFARYLGEKCKGAKDAAEIAALHAADLYLAFASLQGDPAALAALDKKLAKAARGAKSLAPSQVDEVHQRLRERILVAPQGETPKLADYAGAGPLEGWCKVAAVRIALRMQEVPDRETTLQPELLEEGPVPTGIETGAFRRQHAEALAQAFADATRQLTHDERVLLRYHFLDGLNFEEIAPLFQTHRSTISRRVAAARKKLFDATAESLRRRLGADTAELASILKGAKSQIDVDLTAWLRTQI